MTLSSHRNVSLYITYASPREFPSYLFLAQPVKELMSRVRTSSTQVIVSVQDFSTNGFLLNGAHRDPQAKVKVRNTMTSSRSQVLRDGDVLALPNTPFCQSYHLSHVLCTVIVFKKLKHSVYLSPAPPTHVSPTRPRRYALLLLRAVPLRRPLGSTRYRALGH